MVDLPGKTCPNCGSFKMKSWTELTEDEQLLVQRLPFASEYTPEERKMHRFCTRCWYEDENFRRSNTIV